LSCDERMYLRHTTLRKDGKVHRYWRLVCSVRVGRRVIQQTVVQLGKLDARGRLQARSLARHLIDARAGRPVRRRQACSDGSGALEGRAARTFTAVRRRVLGAGAVARHGAGRSVREAGCRAARKRCRGRRWRRCWWLPGCASRRVTRNQKCSANFSANPLILLRRRIDSAQFGSSCQGGVNQPCRPSDLEVVQNEPGLQLVIVTPAVDQDRAHTKLTGDALCKHRSRKACANDEVRPPH
jgi:hypothetical protein